MEGNGRIVKGRGKGREEEMMDAPLSNF